MKKERKSGAAIWVSLILIVITGFACYANSPRGEFLWDDEWIVTANPHIRSFAFLPDVFSTGLFQAYGVGKGSFYRPLQVLTYMVDYKAWGLRPAGYHLTNIILHIACALLLFTIISLLSGDFRPALIGSLLFVAHPIHTQAVTYISGRADPLSVVCMLLSILCFIKYSKIASFVFFILALLSKEAAIALPFFLLFYIFSFEIASGAKFTLKVRPRNDGGVRGTRGRMLATIPFFAAGALYAILRFTALNFSDENFLADTPLFLRLLTTCKNIFVYLGLLIAPAGLHMERQALFVRSVFDPGVIFSLAGLGLIGLWMFRIKRKSPAVFFFAGWFFIGLLPVSNILPLNATLAEHWMYLPSMGIFALAGLGCAKIKIRLLPYFLTLGAVLFYGFLTVERNNDWRDPLTLYLATKKYVPGNFKVRNNLGRLYFGKAMFDDAILEYKASLEIQPRYAQAHSNLGVAYSSKGMHEEAIVEYEKALALVPALSKTYRNLADAYMRTGRMDKALRVFETGAEKCPADPYLFSMFGIALAQAGKLDEAIARGKKGIEAGFGDAGLYYNMAIIYEYNPEGARYGAGFDFKAAEGCYLQALRINPRYEKARYNLDYLYSLPNREKP